MQSPNLTLRIEMFGALIEELDHWHKCCDEESDEGGDELVYCESRFKDVLEACREFRELLLEDLEEYVKDCRRDDIPIDISYYRIKRQLQESSFEYRKP